MGSGYLEVSGGAGGKQWVSGGAGGKQWVSGGAGGSLYLEAQDSKKNSFGDSFQTVPGSISGSIPGSCIPAFTGTHRCLYLHNSYVLLSGIDHYVTDTGLVT